jgi:hypothetical protein
MPLFYNLARRYCVQTTESTRIERIEWIVTIIEVFSICVILPIREILFLGIRVIPITIRVIPIPIRVIRDLVTLFQVSKAELLFCWAMFADADLKDLPPSAQYLPVVSSRHPLHLARDYQNRWRQSRA